MQRTETNYIQLRAKFVFKNEKVYIFTIIYKGFERNSSNHEKVSTSGMVGAIFSLYFSIFSKFLTKTVC